MQECGVVVVVDVGNCWFFVVFGQLIGEVVEIDLVEGIVVELVVVYLVVDYWVLWCGYF